MPEIVLTPDIEERIFAPIGYPLITEEDLEVSFAFLNRTAIYPAVRDYYKYFPLTDHQFYSVSGNFAIPFPTPETYGVVDSRIHSGYNYKGISPQNPFIADRVVSSQAFPGNQGMYGTRNDYGMSEVIPIVNALKKARRSMSKRYRIRVDEQNREVTGYSNMTGQLEIAWASYSLDWTHIKYVYEDDVIALASAYMMQYFARLRSQEESDVPVQFDAAAFQDAAEQIIDDVFTRWRAATKSVMSRK